MAEHNFTQRDDDPVGDRTAADGVVAQSGLDDLIAKVRAQADDSGVSAENPADTAQTGTAAARAPATSDGSGRLVERWLPAAVTGKLARRENRGKRRLATIGLAAAAAAALLTGAALFTGGPVEREPPSPSSLPLAHAAPVSTTPTSTSKAPETVVVSVVGKVAEPGLVTLPSGSRVADALRAAGGLLREDDRRTVNLARTLADGEQLYVGVPVPAGASAGKSAGSPGAQRTVNLNSANAEQLKSLPGVGKVTAQRIIDWRTEHGGFGSVDQLRQVDGIGAKRFADLRDLVSAR